MNIQEDYVSFETAKLLKEKEFDVKCKHYNPKKIIKETSSEGVETYPAPTQALVVKWLRVVHGIHISNEYDYLKDCYNIRFVENSKARWEEYIRFYNSKAPEEAIEQAILYALKELI